MPVYNASIRQIDIAETRRYAGLQNVTFDESRLEDACSEALLYIEPKGSWEIYDYDCQKQLIKSDNPFLIIGEKAGRHLRGAEKIICLAATVGHALEDAVNDYFKKDAYTHALLLDTAAAVAVQQIGNELERMLTPKAAAKGYKMHWRYCPGYGDWPMEAQAELLPLCHGDAIGIGITEAGMLNPAKSITAVIGLYPDGEKLPKDIRGCASCNRRDCIFRKKV